MANSKRRCMHCKEYFLVETMRKTPKGWFCTIEHALQYANKETRARIERADRKKLKEVRQKQKRITDYEGEAQKAFNAYIRARDYGKSCISSGRSFNEVMGKEGWKIGGGFDAGHYMSRGSKPQLRFHLLNVWAQSKSDNAGEGKFSHKRETVSQGYRRNLIGRIGLERVELLENNQEPSKKDQLSRPEYIEYLERVKRIFNKRARYYKKRRGIA